MSADANKTENTGAAANRAETAQTNAQVQSANVTTDIKNAEVQAGAKKQTSLDVLKGDLDAAKTAHDKAARDYADLKNGTDDDIEKYSGAVSNSAKTLADAQKAYDAAVKGSPKGKNKKVRILLPVAGKFKLPHDVGQIAELPEAQAQEVVDAKYGEFVK